MKVRRGTLRDLYVDAGRAAVMVDERVMVLSEVATSILLAVPEHGSVYVHLVAAGVTETHGVPDPPLDAHTLTREQVLDLAAHKILIIDGDAASPPADSELSEPALRALREALHTVLAAGNVHRWELPPDITESAFLATAQRQRVTAQLATRLDILDIPEALNARLRAHHADLTAASVGVARDMHQVLEVLEDAHVRVLVFKGLALAAQAWNDPTARGYGDVDLLVSPADLARAKAALSDAEWTTGYTYPVPGASWGWRQFVRTEYEMAFSRGGTGVDLHWHALPDRGSFPDFEHLWRRRAEVSIDGRAVPTFNPFDALAHSASHSAKDHWRYLRGIADVHRLMSEPGTWHSADRPLGGDQLLTVGLAGKLFGVPPDAPAVVSDAAAKCQHVMLLAQRAQLSPERATIHDWVPGLGTLQMMQPLWHARARPRDFARRLSTSALPPWALARESSPHGYVAAPRAMWHRGAEVRLRLVERRSRSTRQ